MNTNATTLPAPLPARSVALALVALGCGAAGAAEYGTVLSSTPVTAQTPVPQQLCTDEQQVVQQRTSGAGALVGAVIGGAVGNSVGGGAGKAIATGLGLVAGAAIGDRAEANNTPAAVMPVRRCQTVTQYESSVIGYDVTYEYAGQRYSTRVAQDPGRHIALNVTPAAPAAAPHAPVYVPPAATAYAPAPVYVAPAAYPAPVYVAPAPVVVGGGYWGPPRHHHYGYWR